MSKNMNKNMLIQIKNTDDYISDIKCLIAESRQRICKVVNVAMVQTYWLIGKRIVIEEQKGNKKAKYGESVLKKLSKTLTSEFGNARVFNQEVKSYHSGTDFRAAIGTPIYASNSGKVVIAKDRFLAGKSVVIDHGEGIFSMYYHCSEIKVKEGTRVKQGELIALSGNTGRVSGPHLHFGILVRGAQVDPIDFIAKINASLKGN